MKKMTEILLAIVATLVLTILITSLVGNVVEGYFVELEEDIQNVDKEKEVEVKVKNKDSQLTEEWTHLKDTIIGIGEDNKK